MNGFTIEAVSVMKSSCVSQIALLHGSTMNKSSFNPEIKRQKTKTLKVKSNWRIADFITPNFVYWCIGWCRDTFCSVMKYTYKNIYINDNWEQIIRIVWEHAYEQERPRKPNHLDDTYWTYEIWVFTDIGLHREALPFSQIFSFFVDHPYAKAVFTTKYPHPWLFGERVQEKVRIRLSLMPSAYSCIVEPQTPSIEDRLEIIPKLRKAWYEIDFDFGPVIVANKYRLQEYKKLFETIDLMISERMKSNIKAHASFLGHNKRQHKRNLENGYVQAEKLLWRLHTMQWWRRRVSRYLTKKRKEYITQRTQLHDQIIPWNQIRWIG